MKSGKGCERKSADKQQAPTQQDRDREGARSVQTTKPQRRASRAEQAAGRRLPQGSADARAAATHAPTAGHAATGREVPGTEHR